MVVFLSSVIPAFQVAATSSVPQQIQSRLGLTPSDSVSYFKFEEIRESEIESAITEGFLIAFSVDEYQKLNLKNILCILEENKQQKAQLDRLRENYAILVSENSRMTRAMRNFEKKNQNVAYEQVGFDVTAQMNGSKGQPSMLTLQHKGTTQSTKQGSGQQGQEHGEGKYSNKTGVQEHYAQGESQGYSGSGASSVLQQGSALSGSQNQNAQMLSQKGQSGAYQNHSQVPGLFGLGRLRQLTSGGLGQRGGEGKEGSGGYAGASSQWHPNSKK